MAAQPDTVGDASNSEIGRPQIQENEMKLVALRLEITQPRLQPARSQRRFDGERNASCCKQFHAPIKTALAAMPLLPDRTETIRGR